ncbi:hypothetical protein GUITHDRAFT_165803 [Guillardia theta CCMP2712]|uniref:ribose-phosphate diphosphokinase n=1 Tax=Guillardia theta (strain CCMP2712) TaxID=905079 RepID=L1IIZ0_GUITC|nr:hypothetical protein GUITHDRAFT_165803 [Guillardia theta CCMP2712]EKX36228.1 hypothetical protein GUITHDRAFT_165803 [Guillardia theta CCMP2712]|eukprot:XP_005823208.1 hypothetical protein GUITHDRAFT_165803 [Guillardia theta CCMP2712]
MFDSPCSLLLLLLQTLNSGLDTSLKMTKGLTRGHLWKSSNENVLQVVDHEREAEFEGDPKLLDAHNLSFERSPVGIELFQIVAGNSNYALANKIASQLGISISEAECNRFNDGECSIKLGESVRNTHVFVLQSICPGRTSDRTINDHLMELFLLVRCMKRASASRVTAILPYYGYARQDEKTKPRVPIAASDVAMLLEAGGVDRILAVDLHSAQIQGQFQHCPVDNLSMFEDMAEFFMRNFYNKLGSDAEITIVSPDADGTPRAKFFMGLLIDQGIENVSLAITIRQKSSNSIVVNLVGDIVGKHCIIVDDIIDTGSRVCTAAETLIELGAKSVGAFASHGVFSGKALLKIEASNLDYVVVSDSIPVVSDIRSYTTKVVQVSCAALISEAIHSIMTGHQVEHLYSIGTE